MTQAEPATSVDVRAKLEHLLERDLLGPWDGPEEELPPGTSPAERYLLGRLVPRTIPGAPPPPDQAFESDPDLVDREILTEIDDDSDVEPDAAVRSGSMSASALGLSFTVPDDVDGLAVEARWGRYERVPSEVHVTEQGRPRTVWRRKPAGGVVEVPLKAEADDQLVPDPRQEAVVLRYTVRHRGRRRIVDLALVNAQAQPAATPDTARLYQVQLVVTASDGRRAVFLGHNDPDLGDRPSSHDPERLHLALLHRNSRQYAHGRQCAVDAEIRDGEIRAWRLTTTNFPAAEVSLVVPADTRSCQAWSST